ncbi:MAG: hypothetical protein K2J51_06415 [Alistipes sp.]|nr:hypothetical protein [Alistipes sp.]
MRVPSTSDAADAVLKVGELYLFHSKDPQCPASSSLWGIYDKYEYGRLYLESSSRNQRSFRKWHALPKHYRYCRLSSRSELRDYIWNLSYSESRAGLSL